MAQFTTPIPPLPKKNSATPNPEQNVDQSTRMIDSDELNLTVYKETHTNIRKTYQTKHAYC